MWNLKSKIKEVKPNRLVQNYLILMKVLNLKSKLQNNPYKFMFLTLKDEQQMSI